MHHNTTRAVLCAWAWACGSWRCQVIGRAGNSQRFTTHHTWLCFVPVCAWVCGNNAVWGIISPVPATPSAAATQQRAWRKALQQTENPEASVPLGTSVLVGATSRTADISSEWHDGPMFTEQPNRVKMGKGKDNREMEDGRLAGVRKQGKAGWWLVRFY